MTLQCFLLDIGQDCVPPLLQLFALGCGLFDWGGWIFAQNTYFGGGGVAYFGGESSKCFCGSFYSQRVVLEEAQLFRPHISLSLRMEGAENSVLCEEENSASLVTLHCTERWFLDFAIVHGFEFVQLLFLTALRRIVAANIKTSDKAVYAEKVFKLADPSVVTKEYLEFAKSNGVVVNSSVGVREG